MKAKDLFERLQGTWNIKKTLGYLGCALGQAKITLTTEGHLLYREDVEVVIDGSKNLAYKEYIYSIENGALCKKFTDHRLFYELKLGSNDATGEHDCLADHYHASYVFAGNNAFTLEYEVRGPRKYYSIVTEFDRISDNLYPLVLSTDAD
jgi:hypothetical protein